jgi:hypothetical protein
MLFAGIVNYFTLRTSLIFKVTIKNLYDFLRSRTIIQLALIPVIDRSVFADRALRNIWALGGFGVTPA